ncbi:hypothetical protein HYT84_03910 [Candidatus Micrarchaeota archaeon]|nr:hypothetical protein [Candidatus Micrarchaeota archaeon]
MGCMCGTCKSVMGVLVLAAGAELFANVSVAGLTGFQVAGLLFVLHGVGTLVHMAGLCSMCKSCEVETKKK